MAVQPMPSKSFYKSLSFSEPEAEQSFNETSVISEDSVASMNLMATAFVPTPKCRATKQGHPQALHSTPK